MVQLSTAAFSEQQEASESCWTDWVRAYKDSCFNGWRVPICFVIKEINHSCLVGRILSSHMEISCTCCSNRYILKLRFLVPLVSYYLKAQELLPGFCVF